MKRTSFENIFGAIRAVIIAEFKMALKAHGGEYTYNVDPLIIAASICDEVRDIVVVGAKLQPGNNIVLKVREKECSIRDMEIIIWDVEISCIPFLIDHIECTEECSNVSHGIPEMSICKSILNALYGHEDQ